MLEISCTGSYNIYNIVDIKTFYKREKERERATEKGEKEKEREERVRRRGKR